MIFVEERNGGDGVLVVRTADTARPEDLKRRIAAEGWIALFLFSYGDLLFEAWGRTGMEWPGEQSDYLSISEAAIELGITTEALVERMIEDGLIIDTGNGLVASPHPDILPVQDYKRGWSTGR